MTDKKQRKRLREEGRASNSPLKSVFDSSQLSGSIGGALRDLQKTAARETTHRKDCVFF